jgi:hypothetical protein
LKWPRKQVREIKTLIPELLDQVNKHLELQSLTRYVLAKEDNPTLGWETKKDDGTVAKVYPSTFELHGSVLYTADTLKQYSAEPECDQFILHLVMPLYHSIMHNEEWSVFVKALNALTLPRQRLTLPISGTASTKYVIGSVAREAFTKTHGLVLDDALLRTFQHIPEFARPVVGMFSVNGILHPLLSDSFRLQEHQSIPGNWIVAFSPGSGCYWFGPMELEVSSVFGDTIQITYRKQMAFGINPKLIQIQEN